LNFVCNRFSKKGLIIGCSKKSNKFVNNIFNIFAIQKRGVNKKAIENLIIFASLFGQQSVNIILTIFKLISIMKKLILALAIAAFGASSSFAQAPAAPAAAPAAAAQAPATAATEVKKVVAKAKKSVKKAPAAAAVANKMTHQCPKGCSMVDAPGKCPKCSADLVAVGGGAAKKAAKKASAPAAAPAAAAAAPAEVKK
jgi:hypothetical protein